MYDDIGAKLAALRREAGLSQKELAARLTALDEPITDKALSKWEKGATLPSARQFLAVCGALGVEDISGEFAGRGLAHGLDHAGRRKLAEYADLLRRSGLFERAREGGRTIRLYTLAAGAGPGQFLDDDDHRMVEDPDAPEDADFAVCVAGDSMEPRYLDGQRVYVQRSDFVEDGETGIFYWDGNAYIKVLYDRPEGLYLHSLNPAYADIPVTEPELLRVFGRVLG